MPAVTASYGGYSVAPGEADAAQGQPQDPEPISFFDLSLREMLVAVALSFSPVLVYPVELFFSLKLFAALGYRKVGQNAILWNRNRREIFASIAANPGVRFTALERLTGIKEGTLKYHLLILETKRRIVSFGSGRSLRYFENNGRYNETRKEGLPPPAEPDHAEDSRNSCRFPRGLKEGYRRDRGHCRPVDHVAHEAIIWRRDYFHQQKGKGCPLYPLSCRIECVQAVYRGECRRAIRERGQPGMSRGNNPLKITCEAVIVPIHFLTSRLSWRDFERIACICTAIPRHCMGNLSSQLLLSFRDTIT